MVSGLGLVQPSQDQCQGRGYVTLGYITLTLPNRSLRHGANHFAQKTGHVSRFLKKKNMSRDSHENSSHVTFFRT